jgi:hypothetical protein
MPKENAMDALEATRDTHQAAWTKLGKVIAKKRFLGKNYAKEQRLKTRVSAKIGRYNSQLLELQAAETVIAAPSVSEVREVRRQLKLVKELAIKDALLASGLKLINTALSTSSKIAGNIRT